MSNRQSFANRAGRSKFAIARLTLVIAIIMVAVAVIGATYYFTTLGSVTTTNTVPSTQQSAQTTTTQQSTPTTPSTSSTSSSSSSVQGQSGNLSILLTDPPNFPANVTNAYVYYSEIEVHMSTIGNQTTGWYVVAHAGHVSIADLQNFSVTVGNAPLQSGMYDSIRFHIVNATVTYNGVNYTAYVHGDELVVPIQGGITVSAGGSHGLLMDLASVVIPYQNGTSVGFIFASNALCYPFPGPAWHDNYGMMGHMTDLRQQGWWHDAWSHSVGNVTITNASLTPNSLSVTVKNTGSSNVTLFLLSVLYPGNYSCSSSTCTNDHMGDHSGGMMGDHHDHMGYEDFHMFTAFNILSNKTLVQMSHNFDPEHMFFFRQSGVVLAPNQTTTLTFSGPIVSMHDLHYNYNSPSSIISGQQYIIAVLSNFGVGDSVNVTAG